MAWVVVTFLFLAFCASTAIGVKGLLTMLDKPDLRARALVWFVIVFAFAVALLAFVLGVVAALEAAK